MKKSVIYLAAFNNIPLLDNNMGLFRNNIGVFDFS